MVDELPSWELWSGGEEIERRKAKGLEGCRVAGILIDCGFSGKVLVSLVYVRDCLLTGNRYTKRKNSFLVYSVSTGYQHKNEGSGSCEE